MATFSGGIAAGFRICKRLGLNLPGIEFWRDLAEIAARPESSLCSLPDQVQTQLEKTINYTFIDKNLASFAMVGDQVRRCVCLSTEWDVSIDRP